jgi:phosphopantetheine adenylyltransferase
MIASVNRDIESGVQTVLLTPPPEFAKVSSSLVRGLIGPVGWEEIVEKYVPPEVHKALLRKYESKKVSLNTT